MRTLKVDYKEVNVQFEEAKVAGHVVITKITKIVKVVKRTARKYWEILRDALDRLKEKSRRLNYMYKQLPTWDKITVVSSSITALSFTYWFAGSCSGIAMLPMLILGLAYGIMMGLFVFYMFHIIGQIYQSI